MGSRLKNALFVVRARRPGKTSGRSELSLSAVKAVLSGLQRREAVVEAVYAGVSVWSVLESAGVGADCEAELLVPAAIVEDVQNFLLTIVCDE